MNTTEHLQRIKTKCLQKIEAFEKESPALDSIYQTTLKQSVAGWKSTIAAIDLSQEVKYTSPITTRAFRVANALQTAIILEWPEELL